MAKKQPSIVAAPKPVLPKSPPVITLAGKKMLAQWDCADGVDFVTIKLGAYERKLTGGEICSPFEDVVREVPASAPRFRLGYTIETGRLFVISDDPQVSGRTIAWGPRDATSAATIPTRTASRPRPSAPCRRANIRSPLPSRPIA